MPVHRTDGINVLLRNFLVGNHHGFVCAVIGQIPQMHQQRQYIVLAGKGSHVVAECACVDFYSFTCQHSDNCILQAIHIHLDVDF